MTGDAEASVGCWADLFGSANSARSARIATTMRAQLFLRLGLIDLEGSYGVLDALKTDRDGWERLVAEAEESSAAGRAYGARQDAERSRVREMERQLELRETGRVDD